MAAYRRIDDYVWDTEALESVPKNVLKTINYLLDERVIMENLDDVQKFEELVRLYKTKSLSELEKL